ncbi:hypothetical protein AB0E06_38335 [Streptomyces sp. NPDC048109]|uniref:hypothetical protein n=1 Tax=Streptomyces sp. NPDC048109 TaxID=3155482 RepID=UPI0034346232
MSHYPVTVCLPPMAPERVHDALEVVLAPFAKCERAVTAAAKSAAAKWRRVRFRDNREPSTREAPLFDRETRRCWRGVPWLRDWPGKDGDVTHPRDAQGDDR